MGDHRKFGLLVGGLLGLLGAWRLHGDPASLAGAVVGATGGVLVLLGLAAPRALAPVRRVWMAFAHVLGWINTRLLLGIVFYAGFTLVRFGLWLRRKDPMRRRPDPRAATYWHEVDAGPVEGKQLEHPY